MSAASRLNLCALIFQDIKHHPWLVLCAVMVLLSSLAVVYSAHLNREQVSQLDSLRQQYDKLDVQWRNLILEESALDEHSRIAHIATTQLGMHRPEATDEIRVEGQP